MFYRVNLIKLWGLGLFLSSESYDLLIVSIESLAYCRIGSAFCIFS